MHRQQIQTMYQDSGTSIKNQITDLLLEFQFHMYNKAMEPQRKRDLLPLNLAYNVVIIQVGET